MATGNRNREQEILPTFLLLTLVSVLHYRLRNTTRPVTQGSSICSAALWQCIVNDAIQYKHDLQHCITLPILLSSDKENKSCYLQSHCIELTLNTYKRPHTTFDKFLRQWNAFLFFNDTSVNTTAIRTCWRQYYVDRMNRLCRGQKKVWTNDRGRRW